MNTPIYDNLNTPEHDKSWRDDLKDFIRTSRKAVTAAGGALAAGLGAAIPVIVADGKIESGEVVPALIIVIGSAIAVGLAVYQVPNDAA